MYTRAQYLEIEEEDKFTPQQGNQAARAQKQSWHESTQLPNQTKSEMRLTSDPALLLPLGTPSCPSNRLRSSWRGNETGETQAAPDIAKALLFFCVSVRVWQLPLVHIVIVVNMERQHWPGRNNISTFRHQDIRTSPATFERLLTASIFISSENTAYRKDETFIPSTTVTILRRSQSRPTALPTAD
ncbi:hypothetical protein EPUS_04290 [Endocarpon pusillum Z07020]|uniref:Uncharacterized protein n=1 Tax=Endocarpon pusillum (strain Z07020 / HMAS-L-300199) TaxID=1263415 RepID=U1HQW6_ENDPU|nr:uncharacterized protein EPUS_04290 [Endocarpon pusillum Z07020]ERF72855.1 hypothetical protein EPUS_04290 [Endocarpon pusillum Z07020]